MTLLTTEAQRKKQNAETPRTNGGAEGNALAILKWVLNFRFFPCASVAKMSDLAISFADVAAAHERIHGKAHRTPVLTS